VDTENLTAAELRTLQRTDAVLHEVLGS
jgi:hypothetical protein